MWFTEGNQSHMGFSIALVQINESSDFRRGQGRGIDWDIGAGEAGALIPENKRDF